MKRVNQYYIKTRVREGMLFSSFITFNIFSDGNASAQFIMEKIGEVVSSEINKALGVTIAPSQLDYVIVSLIDSYTEEA